MSDNTKQSDSERAEGQSLLNDGLGVKEELKAISIRLKKAASKGRSCTLSPYEVRLLQSYNLPSAIELDVMD